LHLGYRKGGRGGVWIARLYHDGKYLKKGIGKADDSDGVGLISYKEAHARACVLGRDVSGFKSEEEPYTVGDAISDYLDWYRNNKKAYNTTRHAADLHIVPKLGQIKAAELTAKKIKDWRDGLVKSQPRARSSKFGKVQRLRKKYDERARRSTTNRVLTILKAALNQAWENGKVSSNAEWSKVSPFQNVDDPKIRYLSADECTRLINACAPDFRKLVKAALFTGCRYGELTRLAAGDFNPDAGTVLLRVTKSGKPRHVYLNNEGRRFFETATAGKNRGSLIFIRTDGNPWGSAHQQRPLVRACKAARITPAISFHILRHTYGSLLAMKGVPLQVIAEALGHADTRVTQKHYAHLLPSYVADTIRANLPEFGTETEKVIRLATKRRKA
jgi:integrase